MIGFILGLFTVSGYLFAHVIENSFFPFIINLSAIAYTAWLIVLCL